MGTSSLPYRYRINGVIDTNRPVLENIETLCSAAGSFLSYDVNDGKWSVVINKAGPSVQSFGDGNIIGPISVSSTGLTELYNSVSVEFPHVDLNDQLDFVSVTIPDADRNVNEPDNRLQLQFDCINDPVQAEYLGYVELQQNRLDKVVRFRTDYSCIHLKAGDIIDITNNVYEFTNKYFRIVELTETDDDGGGIDIEITAIEYSDDVYSTDDLFRYERSIQNGINTIGNIGIPGTPTITKIERDSHPRVFLESTAPTGVVDGMEFWYSKQPELSEELRTYNLISTVKPLGSANVFAFGTDVNLTTTVSSITSGNLAVKTRGKNGTTVGPFSSSTNFVYTPVQTTNAINQNTEAAQDDNGTGALLAGVGVLGLLQGIDGVFSGNTGAGSVFGEIFDIFDTDTGYDILEDAGNIQTISNNLSGGVLDGAMISASAGTTTQSGLGQTAGAVMYQTTFTAPFAGGYKLDAIIDQNSSGAQGGRGSYWSENNDTVSVAFTIATGNYASLGGSVVTSAGSGGVGAFFWTDFVLTNQATLSTGTTYYLEFSYVQQTASIPAANASFDISWNVYSYVRT